MEMANKDPYRTEDIYAMLFNFKETDSLNYQFENFFIDNMPTEELSELDPEQISRIIHMATASRYLKSRQNVDTTGIMYEVN